MGGYPCAKGAQGIVDGVHDDGRGGAGPGFADALGAEFGNCGRRLDMHHVNVGHFARHGGQIIRHGAVLQLACFVIDAMFEQGAADTLHAAAANLFVGELRIDHPAAILHHPMPEQLDEPGVGIDLHIGALNAVGEDIKGIGQPETARHGQDRLQGVGQFAELKMADPANLRQRNADCFAARIDHIAIDDVERAGFGLKQRPGNDEDFFTERPRRLIGGFATDGGGARCVGAAAIGRGVCVAFDHPNAVDGNAQRRGGDLAHDGIHTLALIGDADRADDPTGGFELDGAGVLRRDGRAAGAVIAVRPGGGALDEGGDADTALNAFFTERSLFFAERGVTHSLFQGLEAGLMRQILHLDSGG